MRISDWSSDVCSSDLHCRTAEERALVDAAMREDRPLPAGTSMKVIAHESGVQAINSELRKREQPFALKLEPSAVRAAERASYFGAYKGVRIGRASCRERVCQYV